MPPRRVRLPSTAMLVAAALASISLAVVLPPRSAPEAPADLPAPLAGEIAIERLPDPDRTVVRDAAGLPLVVLTDGARTAVLTGPRRTFTEAGAALDTTAWVRFAPVEWTAGAEVEPWFRPWLESALADTAPDVLAVALEYLPGAPERYDPAGLKVAGDASFGPLRPDGGRYEASDFYDYLGVPWVFPDGVQEAPEPRRLGAADCSGFLRLVLGYRLGYPLLGGPGPGPGLPRRARDMAAHGPGALLLAERDAPPAGLDRLQAGDLLFFVTDDEPGLDHSALYLGVDRDGRHRFLSSRSSVDGPTLADVNGASVLDGDGHFARGFRAARRL